ncbi:MAG: transcriptional regulator NrdR [Verrucomicrobiales bacterium]
MRCPKCGCIEDKVVDSRQAKDGSSTRRRRICVGCDHRFTTYEEIERADLRVLKRDGRLEAFDRSKLIAGLLKSCEKRPINREMVEQMVDEIISDLEGKFGRQVSSRSIGLAVMEHLHALDEVAYVRYASVYRQFQDVGEFIDTINALASKSKSNRAQVELFELAPSRS